MQFSIPPKNYLSPLEKLTPTIQPTIQNQIFLTLPTDFFPNFLTPTHFTWMECVCHELIKFQIFEISGRI